MKRTIGYLPARNKRPAGLGQRGLAGSGGANLGGSPARLEPDRLGRSGGSAVARPSQGIESGSSSGAEGSGSLEAAAKLSARGLGAALPSKFKEC